MNVDVTLTKAEVKHILSLIRDDSGVSVLSAYFQTAIIPVLFFCGLAVVEGL